MVILIDIDIEKISHAFIMRVGACRCMVMVQYRIISRRRMLWSHAVQRRDRRADENEKDLGLGFLWIGPGGLIQKCGESNFDINVGTNISLSGLEAVCSA